MTKLKLNKRLQQIEIMREYWHQLKRNKIRKGPKKRSRKIYK